MTSVEKSLSAMQRAAPLAQCRSSSYVSCRLFGVLCVGTYVADLYCAGHWLFLGDVFRKLLQRTLRFRPIGIHVQCLSRLRSTRYSDFTGRRLHELYPCSGPALLNSGNALMCHSVAPLPNFTHFLREDGLGMRQSLVGVCFA